MNYSNENLIEIARWGQGIIDSYIHSDKPISPAIADKISHILHVVEIVRSKWPDDKMAEITALLHDIGRFGQWEARKDFREGGPENLKLHHEYGYEMLQNAVDSRRLQESPELDIIRQVVRYHGRPDSKEEEMPDEVVRVKHIIERVDDVENGCLGAVGYLIREATEDTKGYIDRYKKEFFESHGTMPSEEEIDTAMKQVSPAVLKAFKEGKKFNKLEYCNTYADYTLFAAVLAIQALRGREKPDSKYDPEYRKLARSVMQDYKCSRPIINEDGTQGKKVYKNAIDGYEDIFGQLIEPRYQKVAVDVLKGFYKDPNYEYREEPDGLDGH